MVNWRMPFTPKKTSPSIRFYGLTSYGREVAQNRSMTGARMDVIDAIDFQQNRANIGDIVRDAQMNPKLVKQVLRALIQEGAVERITGTHLSDGMV